MAALRPQGLLRGAMALPRRREVTMDEATDQADAVEHAAALAREIAPDLGAILFTHYPDADTLDTLRPGSAELGAVTAANRAAAAELAAAGVQVFVQVADKASFRR